MRSFLIFQLILAISLIGLLPSVPVQSQTPVVNSSITDIMWSPAGNMLAISGNFGAALYDANFQLRKVLTNQSTDILAWSPDGTLLATNSYTNDPFVVKLWDIQTSQIIATIPLSTYAVMLVWSPDSQRLAIIGHGVEVYEIATQTRAFTLTSPSPVRDVAWSPDGTRIAAVGGGDRTEPDTQAVVNVWSASNGVLEFSIDTTVSEQFSNIFAMDWSSDSAKIALGIGISNKGSIPILDIVSQTISTGYVGPIDPITFMACSPDGSRFAASDNGSTGSTLTIWNATTYERLWFLSAPDSGSYMDGDWKPDGSQLAMLIKTFTNNIPQTSVHILDAETGVEITVLELPAVTPTPTPTATPDPCTAYSATVPDLISAITTANISSGIDTLCLSSGATYPFTTAHIPLKALPAITSEITILGNGATLTRQAGAALFGFFEVSAGAAGRLRNVCVAGTGTAGLSDDHPRLDSGGQNYLAAALFASFYGTVRAAVTVCPRKQTFLVDE